MGDGINGQNNRQIQRGKEVINPENTDTYLGKVSKVFQVFQGAPSQKVFQASAEVSQESQQSSLEPYGIKDPVHPDKDKSEYPQNQPSQQSSEVSTPSPESQGASQPEGTITQPEPDEEPLLTQEENQLWMELEANEKKADEKPTFRDPPEMPEQLEDDLGVVSEKATEIS